VEQARASAGGPAHIGEAVSPVRGEPYLASRPTFLPCPYFFSAPGPVLPLPSTYPFRAAFFPRSKLGHCSNSALPSVSRAQRAYSREWERHSAELIIAYRASPTRRTSMTRDSPRSLRGARLPCAAATVRPVPPAGPPRYPSRRPSSWRHWGPVHLSAIHAAHPRRP